MKCFFKLVFAAYLWGSVLSVYQDMERRLENKRILQNPEIAYIKKMDLKRKRARSLLDETTLYKTACLNNFEFKDVPQIILQMLRRADEMSQDSLLGPGMMLASVSNMGSFDNLKKSESLGELGYTNLQSTKVIGLDEEENLSPPEKALKFLKMTWSDVRNVQRNRTCMESDMSSRNSDPWFYMSISDAHIYKPKKARTEIFIRELPELEFEEDYKYTEKTAKKTYDIKLGVSLFNLIKKIELDSDEDEESFVDSQEETEGEEEERDEEEMSQIFMSNIKDEKPVNRIGLNITKEHIKGTAYNKLYKKDFMSTIGPEVFERATKLPKVTSLDFRKLKEGKKSVQKISFLTANSDSQLEISGSNFSENSSFPDEDSEKSDSTVNTSTRVAEEITQDLLNFLIESEEKEKEFWLSGSESHFDPAVSEEESRANGKDFGSLDGSFQFPKSTEENDSNIKEPEPETRVDDSQKISDPKMLLCFNTPPPQEEIVKVKKILPPCYRKRRIKIRWIGKLKENNLIECVSTNSSLSNSSNDSSNFPKTPETNSEPSERSADDTEPPQEKQTPPARSSVLSKKSDISGKELTEDREIYFLMELLHKPLPEVLRKYYDLKNMVYTRRKSSTMYQKQLEFKNNLYGMYRLKRFEEMGEFGGKRYKVWKSKVLKIAEAHKQPITGDFLKIDHEVINKLLRYQYLFLMSKMKETNSIGSFLQEYDTTNRREQLELNSPESRNELRSRSHSENAFQDHKLLKENKNINSDKKIVSQNPSENSVEVCRKDLIKGETYTSEEVPSTSKEVCSKDKEFKTSDDKEFFENADDDSLCSQESDEPISLYYSKAANLASPLLDMKKFIYPDHIHYSYKHVNKKGFDVNISGDLPLLVQSQALAPNNNLQLEEIPARPEPEITRRPMDLSFAKTNAFAEWQNSDQNVSDSSRQVNEKYKRVKATPSSEEMNKRKKGKKSKKKKAYDEEASTSNGTSSNSHHVYFTPNNSEKVPSESSETSQCRLTYDEERTPVQISSTQLHSNKGRISSTYSPALRLQENRKEGKKKAESQEKRTKDMLARLEREFLFQNKNGFNSSKP